MSPGLLQDWQLDIKAYKVDCKNCVNRLVVAVASSQSGDPSSVPPGGEKFFTLLLNWCSKAEAGLQALGIG